MVSNRCALPAERDFEDKSTEVRCTSYFLRSIQMTRKEYRTEATRIGKVRWKRKIP